jgi:hypothetical protein
MLYHFYDFFLMHCLARGLQAINSYSVYHLYL